MRKWVLLLAAATLATALAGCGRGKPQDAQESGRAGKAALPPRTVHVFCYHGVEPDTSNSFFNRTEDFKVQMQVLADEGFQSISCKQLADYLVGAEDIPDKSVLLTFDDGNECVYGTVCPILESHGFKATLFLITSSVDAKNHMSWQQVQELHTKGYEIGSHTVTHANLVKRGSGQSAEEHKATVLEELTASKQAIERVLGDGTVTALAYPYGTYDGVVMAAAREAGYRLAFSIDRGAADQESNPWRLPRQMVVRDNSLKTFKRWLAQEPLHLAGISPPVGEVVAQTNVEIHARLMDNDVSPSGLSVEAGKGTDMSVVEGTNEIVISTTLRKGANNVRLQHQGTPSRETSWVVVCRP